MMKALCSFCVSLLVCGSPAAAATVTEGARPYATYPFSDPDPVANPHSRLYPYFRFDGYAAEARTQAWNVVTLENDIVRVDIFPQVGGKVWGAWVKKAPDGPASRPYLYVNDAVKFRDIALRGPWTSGGIEFNFGIVGHVPSASTPVDYLARTNGDGSVSCFLSSLELLTDTSWCVEVRLADGEACFTTRTRWYNGSGCGQPYYQWMNAAYAAGEDLDFYFPGDGYIGHPGDAHAWPRDAEGRELSRYAANAFGADKSYHVFGSDAGWYAAYWRGANLGSYHYAPYDEKLGRKIWIWSLSRKGGIWEDLLTDHGGQYVELQAGRFFNQPMDKTIYTPFKHREFTPGKTDAYTEYWGPALDIGAFSGVSRSGSVAVSGTNGTVRLTFSPSRRIKGNAFVVEGGTRREFVLDLQPLQKWQTEFTVRGDWRFVLGDGETLYSSAGSLVSRPRETKAGFNWDSAQGLCVLGEQAFLQRENAKAEGLLRKAIAADPSLAEAQVAMARLLCQLGRWSEAIPYCKGALAFDTYDGAANYYWGLAASHAGPRNDAKDGFSIAAFSAEYTSAAYVGLARLAARDGDWPEVGRCAGKALTANEDNLDAWQALLYAARESGDREVAAGKIRGLLKAWPLCHAARYEAYRAGLMDKAAFQSLIRCELPAETYLKLAESYLLLGAREDALALLEMSGKWLYEQAYLLKCMGRDGEAGARLAEADRASVAFVFPFRPFSLDAYLWANSQTHDERSAYLAALVMAYENLGGPARRMLAGVREPRDVNMLLAKAQLLGGKDAAALAGAALSRAPDSWRAVRAAMNAALDSGDNKSALGIGKAFLSRHADDYRIGLLTAKAGLRNGLYADAAAICGSLRVLPCEGAEEGHVVYRMAWMMAAVECLEKKDGAGALKAVAAARLWPENLGVGKPYDDQIDERAENFAEALALRLLGREDEAKAAFGRVKRPGGVDAGGPDDALENMAEGPGKEGPDPAFGSEEMLVRRLSRMK
jgi:tetratricopeptide (TPR) repeat protein